MINYAQYAHSVHHTEQNRPYYHLLELARLRPVHNFVVALFYSRLIILL